MQRPVPPPATPSRATDSPRNPLLQLSLSVEAERAERTRTLLGEAARSLLNALDVPPPLAQRLADAATSAARYLVGHSRHPRYRLWIHADPAGITLTVTDYLKQPTAGQPDWLPVPRTGDEAHRGIPDAASREDGVNHRLDVRRTLDDHLLLTYRTPWTEWSSQSPPADARARPPDFRVDTPAG